MLMEHQAMKARTWLSGFALSVLVFVPTNSMATVQVPDVIIIDGKDESLHTNPLAPYLSAHPNLMPRSDDPTADNWRGYVATWEILEGKLFLRKIDVAFRNNKAPPNEDARIIKNVIHKIFPDSLDLVAAWYSGALVIPRGKLVKYVHMGYGSTYESYTIVTVNKGVVSRKLDLSAEDFAKYRESQFQAYKRTSEYATKFREAKSYDPSYSDEFVESVLQTVESERYLSIDFNKPE
jgi:hypothetical protein